MRRILDEDGKDQNTPKCLTSILTFLRPFYALRSAFTKLASLTGAYDGHAKRGKSKRERYLDIVFLPFLVFLGCLGWDK